MFAANTNKSNNEEIEESLASSTTRPNKARKIAENSQEKVELSVGANNHHSDESENRDEESNGDFCLALDFICNQKQLPHKGTRAISLYDSQLTSEEYAEVYRTIVENEIELIQIECQAGESSYIFKNIPNLQKANLLNRLEHVGFSGNPSNEKLNENCCISKQEFLAMLDALKLCPKLNYFHYCYMHDDDILQLIMDWAADEKCSLETLSLTNFIINPDNFEKVIKPALLKNKKLLFIDFMQDDGDYDISVEHIKELFVEMQKTSKTTTGEYRKKLSIHLNNGVVSELIDGVFEDDKFTAAKTGTEKEQQIFDEMCKTNDFKKAAQFLFQSKICNSANAQKLLLDRTARASIDDTSLSGLLFSLNTMEANEKWQLHTQLLTEAVERFRCMKKQNNNQNNNIYVDLQNFIVSLLYQNQAERCRLEISDMKFLCTDPILVKQFPARLMIKIIKEYNEEIFINDNDPTNKTLAGLAHMIIAQDEMNLLEIGQHLNSAATYQFKLAQDILAITQNKERFSFIVNIWTRTNPSLGFASRMVEFINLYIEQAPQKLTLYNDTSSFRDDIMYLTGFKNLLLQNAKKGPRFFLNILIERSLNPSSPIPKVAGAIALNILITPKFLENLRMKQLQQNNPSVIKK